MLVSMVAELISAHKGSPPFVLTHLWGSLPHEHVLLAWKLPVSPNSTEAIAASPSPPLCDSSGDEPAKAAYSQPAAEFEPKINWWQVQRD